jgi:hypothetical protein
LHRNCAFINFTNISSAIKAIEGIKSKPDYTSLRIAHGKDRCANPPRSGPQATPTGGRRSAGGVNGMEPTPIDPTPIDPIPFVGKLPDDVDMVEVDEPLSALEANGVELHADA